MAVGQRRKLAARHRGKRARVCAAAGEWWIRLGTAHCGWKAAAEDGEQAQLRGRVIVG
jgi:hypothetical protein